MVILSSPSGAGKTTLVKKFLKIRNLKYHISHHKIAKAKRKNGKIIILSQKISLKNSLKMENSWSMQSFDNYYGSSKKLVIDEIKKGKILSLI